MNHIIHIYHTDFWTIIHIIEYHIHVYSYIIIAYHIYSDFGVQIVLRTSESYTSSMKQSLLAMISFPLSLRVRFCRGKIAGLEGHFSPDTATRRGVWGDGDGEAPQREDTRCVFLCIAPLGDFIWKVTVRCCEIICVFFKPVIFLHFP